MFTKEQITLSSTSAAQLGGVRCHWLSSAAMRLSSESLNLSKSAALQHRQPCALRRAKDRGGERRKELLDTKISPYGNISLFSLHFSLRRG